MHLLTLSSVASYVHPASVLPENALGLTFDSETPLSPLILPFHAQSDPVYTPVPQPQEEGATISSTLLSLSYHVQSPSPMPAPPPAQTSLVTRHPDTHFPSLLLLLLLHRKRQVLIIRRIALPCLVWSSSLTHTLLQHALRTFLATTHISITLSATRPTTPGD